MPHIKHNVRQDAVNVLSSTQISFIGASRNSSQANKNVHTEDISSMGLMYTVQPPHSMHLYLESLFLLFTRILNNVRRNIKSFANFNNKYIKNRRAMDSQENITFYTYNCLFLCVSLVLFFLCLSFFCISPAKYTNILNN